MSKRIEEITKRIEEKEQERTDTINQARAERAELTAKLTELEEKQKAPESLEEYKKTAQEIRDTQAYIDYVTTRQNNAKSGVLSNAEFNEMRKDILAEITARQASAAAEIQEKFYPVIELMEKYSAEVFGLEDLINQAKSLNNPKALPEGGNKAYAISEINPDKYGYWQQFCYTFFRVYPDAMRMKHEEAHPWKKPK